MSEPESVLADPEPPLSGWMKNLVRRVVRVSLCVLLAFAIIILIGLIPMNNGFQESPDGIEVFVTSNPVHAEIVMPIESNVINWRDQFPRSWFPEETRQATHVAIGWGDRGFFLRTPTWAELRLSVAANALFLPSETCLHVTMKSSVIPGANTRAVRISEQQYTLLVEYINDAFRRDSTGAVVQVTGEHYSRNDAFFESHGTYHLLNTCNSWVGRALQKASVRVGWMTPLPKTVFWYLPN
jgi:uncharacterized protein (TIGR02117 family)